MHWLASFPGLPTIQFLITCSIYAKLEGEGVSTFITLSDINVYLGRQRGGGEEGIWGFFMQCRSLCWSSECSQSEKVATCGTGQRTHVWNALFYSRTLPYSSVYLGRYSHHLRDKWYQAFPLCFCIVQGIKNWMVGRPGNATMHCQCMWVSIKNIPQVKCFNWYFKHIQEAS